MSAPRLGLIGQSLVMNVLRRQVRILSRRRPVPVLLVGERGTRACDVAAALHEGAAASEALETLTCRGLSPAHLADALGRLRSSCASSSPAGTLFLDDVDALSDGARLVLEERLAHGAPGARIVSSTDGRFLAERSSATTLIDRLGRVVLWLPPLRHRMEDLEELAQAVTSLVAGPGAGAARLSPDALEHLTRLDWPANLDQLEAVLRAAATIGAGGAIGLQEVAAAWERTLGEPLDAGAASRPAPDASPSRTLRQIEYDAIASAFAEARGNVTRAARRLGIPRSTLRDRLRRFGMR